MRGHVAVVGLAAGVERAVRILEQSHSRLHKQHASHCLIELLERNFAVADERREVSREDTALQAHVQPGSQAELGGLALIRGEAVRNQLEVGGVVGDHETLESPLCAQDVGEQQSIGRGRHTVDVVEGGHDREGARIDRGLEGRQVNFAQGLQGYVDCVVVESARNAAICGEMFGRGQERLLRGQVVSLEAAHPGGGKACTQERVFTRAFRDPPPALVAGHVHHGRVRPLDTLAGCFQRHRTGVPFRELGLETGRLAQWNRKHGAHTVNDIGTEQQRNPQSALFDGDALHLAPCGGTDAVEERADVARANHFAHLRRRPCESVRVHVEREGPGRVGEAGQLSDFLLEGHAPDERFDMGPKAIHGLLPLQARTFDAAAGRRIEEV